jgi:hypothetical protein
MFVGHLGVGLALRRAEDQVSLGVLFAAVLLLDFLLGLFVWLGLERVIVPDDYARLHYLRFEFPYSHGLLASLAWSALAFGATAAWLRGRPRRATAAAVVALAVFSHFPCDALEHPPELPLAGPGSPAIGLGLWDHLGVALGVEAALVAVGLALYLGAVAHPGRRKRLVLVAVMVALSALVFGGQALSPAPPSTTANVIAWLTLPVALGLFGFWIDRPSREA